MRSHQLAEVDVVVVGCGPVGALLGNLLGLQGIATLVLERDPAVYPLPRAVHFDDDVMRLLQTVGLADAMRDRVHVSPGMRFVDDDDRLLLDWSRPLAVGPQGWNVSYRFHQPELEAVLRAGLERWPRVSFRPGCEVLSVQDGAVDASVRFRDVARGAEEAVRARYVVGCDGARSLVRRLIGSGVEDLGFHERWLVVDAILARPRPDLGDYSVQYCNPSRPATYVRGTGERRRWEITLHAGEDAPEITQPRAVFDLLARWITPDDATIERAAVYTFHSLIAERWRAGRLLIAGDAAHMTPPFLGQGMCAGMRDAGNLAWKLARVLRRQDGEALLDTYQSERAPHVREYIELAVRLGGLINTQARDAALAGYRGSTSGPARMSSIKPRLGPGLGHDADPLRGSVAPQPTLSDGRRLDDAVGYAFAALMRPAVARTLPPALVAAMAEADVVIVAEPALAEWLDAQHAQAVVVRPDRCVLGAASNAAGLQHLLRTLSSLSADAAPQSQMVDAKISGLGCLRNPAIEPA